ncbi:MAG: carboxypeptidase-like regulatory domain-containing protein [bacterium]
MRRLKSVFFYTAILLLLLTLFLITPKRRNGSGCSEYDAVRPPDAQSLTVVSSRPIQEEDAGAFDPMTGVIAGRLAGGPLIVNMEVYDKTGSKDKQFPVTWIDNEFRLEGIPAGEYYLELLNDNYWRAFERVVLKPGEIRDDIVIQPPRDLCLSVLSPDNKRLPPQPVMIVVENTFVDNLSVSREFVRDLSEKSEIEISILPGLETHVTLATVNSGGIFRRRIPVDLDSSDPICAEIQLDPWPFIMGTAMNEEGEGIPEVNVVLWDLGLNEYAIPPTKYDTAALLRSRVRNVADEGGRFRINAPPGQRVMLSFFDDLRPAITVQNLRVGIKPVEVTVLPPKGAVRVRGKAPDGSAVRQWRAGRPLLTPLGDEKNGRAAEIEADGLAIFRAVEPGQYQVKTYAHGETKLDEIVVRSGETVNLEAIVDPDGPPRESTYRHANPFTSGETTTHPVQIVMIDNSHRPRTGKVFSRWGFGSINEDGSLTLTSPYANLPPSAHGMSVSAPGYVMDWQWTMKQDSVRRGDSRSTSSIQVGLKRTAVVQGRVVSATGAPVAGALVQSHAMENRDSMETATKDDGTFMANLCAYSKYQGQSKGMLSIKHEHYPTMFCEIDNPEPGILYAIRDIVLSEPRTVVVEMTCEDPNQEHFWRMMHSTGCRFSGSDRIDPPAPLREKRLYPAGRYDIISIGYNAPGINFYLASDFWNYLPDSKYIRRCETRNQNDILHITIPGIPIKHVRIVDQKGDPFRHASAIVHTLKIHHNMVNILFGRSSVSYEDVHINQVQCDFHGEADLVLPENVDLVVLVVPYGVPGGGFGFSSSGGMPDVAFRLGPQSETVELVTRKTKNSTALAAVPK